MTLPGDENYEEEAYSALTPGIEEPKTPEQASIQRDRPDAIKEESSAQSPPSDSRDSRRFLSLFPDDSDEDGSGRRGFLSTYTEVHAFVVGVAAGAHFGLSGDAQIINDVVGLTVTGDRARQADVIPDKYQDQAKDEVPTFLAGVALGYAATRTDVFEMLNFGE